MKNIISNRRIAKELIKQGLLPDACRLLEVSIGVDGATILRYERMVYADDLAKVAEALRVAASEATADDERNRLALESNVQP